MSECVRACVRRRARVLLEFIGLIRNSFTREKCLENVCWTDERLFALS